MKNLTGKKISVLDKGWIELQDYMGSDNDIVAAARASYRGDSKGDKADKKLLFYLMEHRHTTPFEMVELKFRVHCPVVTAWQWVRHRTWSYNFSSGRYTEFKDDEFYLPDVWRLQDQNNKQGSKGVVTDTDDKWWLDTQIEQTVREGLYRYQKALEMGVAREQARLFLPGFAAYYTFVAKTDLHNLLHFLKLRMDDHAQYEIRVYAQAIYEHFVKPLFPWTAEAFEEFQNK